MRLAAAVERLAAALETQQRPIPPLADLALLPIHDDPAVMLEAADDIEMEAGDLDPARADVRDYLFDLAAAVRVTAQQEAATMRRLDA